MSKGSQRRPQFIADKKFEDNWDRIFGSLKTGEFKEIPDTHELKAFKTADGWEHRVVRKK